MDTTTVGVDLAKNVFVACVADCTGRIMARREPYNPQAWQRA